MYVSTLFGSSRRRERMFYHIHLPNIKSIVWRRAVRLLPTKILVCYLQDFEFRYLSVEQVLGDFVLTWFTTKVRVTLVTCWQVKWPIKNCEDWSRCDESLLGIPWKIRSKEQVRALRRSVGAHGWPFVANWDMPHGFIFYERRGC